METFAKLSDRSKESEMLAWTTSANTKKKICRLYISTISLHSMSEFVLSLLDNAPNYILSWVHYPKENVLKENKDVQNENQNREL